MERIHHTTKTGMTCTICGNPILNIWYNAAETSGKSEMYQERKGGEVAHFACIPGAKTLHEINEERKREKFA